VTERLTDRLTRLWRKTVRSLRNYSL